jgi:hypothetical protein
MCILRRWPIFHTFLLFFHTVLPFSLFMPTFILLSSSTFPLVFHVHLLCLSDFYFVSCAGILEQSTGARNRVGIGLSHHPPCYIGWRNRSFESIPGLLKSLKIPSLPSSSVLYSFMSISCLLSLPRSSSSYFFLSSFIFIPCLLVFFVVPFPFPFLLPSVSPSSYLYVSFLFVFRSVVFSLVLSLQLLF